MVILKEQSFVTDDPQGIRNGIGCLFDALECGTGCNSFRDFYMEGSPGAVVAANDRMNEWLKINLDRFRKAHPDGGVFSLSRNVRIATTDNSPTNSENFNEEVVNSFSLDSRGQFHFRTRESNAYYDVDLRENSDVSLDAVIESIRQTDSDENICSVFRQILERADSDFRCEGELDYLMRKDWREPDSGFVMIKNTLPLDTVIPERGFGFMFSPEKDHILDLYIPNGKNLGLDRVFELSLSGITGSVVNLWNENGFNETDLAGREWIHAFDGEGMGYLPYISAQEVVSMVARRVFSEENFVKLAPCYVNLGMAVPDVSGVRKEYCSGVTFDKSPHSPIMPSLLLLQFEQEIVRKADEMYRKLVSVSPKFMADAGVGKLDTPPIDVRTDPRGVLFCSGSERGTLAQVLSRYSQSGKPEILKKVDSMVKAVVRKEKAKILYERLTGSGKKEGMNSVKIK